MVPNIREASERERATDDAEAVTDAASFRNTSRYLQTSSSDGDAVLEKALPPTFEASAVVAQRNRSPIEKISV